MHLLRIADNAIGRRAIAGKEIRLLVLDQLGAHLAVPLGPGVVALQRPMLLRGGHWAQLVSQHLDPSRPCPSTSRGHRMPTTLAITRPSLEEGFGSVSSVCCDSLSGLSGLRAPPRRPAAEARSAHAERNAGQAAPFKPAAESAPGSAASSTPHAGRLPVILGVGLRCTPRDPQGRPAVAAVVEEADEERSGRRDGARTPG